MTLIKTGGLFYLFVLFFVSAHHEFQNSPWELPPLKVPPWKETPWKLMFQALKPKGFRVHIPDDEFDSEDNFGLAFQGNINQPLDFNSSIGILNGEFQYKRDGRWIYEDLETRLKLGDVINYLVCEGYLSENFTFIVRALEDPAGQSTTDSDRIVYPDQSSAYNKFPEISIQALKPKGVRVSIPYAAVIGKSITFQAFVNQPISKTSDGTIIGTVFKSWDKRRAYEDLEIQLKIGDVINYHVIVCVDEDHVKKLTFAVTDLDDQEAYPSMHQITKPTLYEWDCKPSLTSVRGRLVCSGQTIFEDHFDELKEDVWQIEQYIPTDHAEYPFVSYQRATVSVSNGLLRIAPRLQSNMPGYNNDSILSGTLNLFKSCTGSANECSHKASGASILPPVVGGRITSKGLAFTYGTVHIRAKFPQGDWLYPELLLEPFRKKYGENFASGAINIARARGNKVLNIGVTHMGNKVLFGGPIMDFDCQQHFISETRLNAGNWGDDFHVYSVEWTPEHIILSVDFQEWARVEPTGKGLVDLYPPVCSDLPRELLAEESKMAPFDDYFYITLGVAAGGISEFSDDVYTQNFRSKPWRNEGRKAALKFWEDVDSWSSTWTNPELLVDYIKVVAL